jgi:DNA transformation protein
MSVTPSYRTFIVEQLSRVRPGIRVRSMFGGVGIYADELFFALADNDTLYFKVDDTNRPEFEASGMGPFQPYGPGGEVMQYYQVPEEVLEDVEMLGSWVHRSVDVARRKKSRRGKNPRR